MISSVFIATSFDGFIAKEDGNIDWLDTAGMPDADMGEDADMGFFNFINSVDCIVMGRKTMEVISNMNLSDGQWPYGDLPIIVLSKTIKEPPINLKDYVNIYSGDLGKLVEDLKNDGYEKIYVDGGKTIQSFIELKLLNEMIISKAPVILGSGISLFGRTENNIVLDNISSKVYPNGFIQEHFIMRYL